MKMWRSAAAALAAVWCHFAWGQVFWVDPANSLLIRETFVNSSGDRVLVETTLWVRDRRAREYDRESIDAFALVVRGLQLRGFVRQLAGTWMAGEPSFSGGSQVSLPVPAHCAIMMEEEWGGESSGGIPERVTSIQCAGSGKSEAILQRRPGVAAIALIVFDQCYQAAIKNSLKK